MPTDGPVPPPTSVVVPLRQRFLDLLRGDEVDVRVDAAGRQDLALAGDDVGARADDDVDARLDVGIAGLADAGDAAVLDADIGFDDAPVIEDDHVGDHQVGHLGGETLALAHAVADDLAAAEGDFVTVDGAVLLDLDDQFGVGKPDSGRPWSGRRARRSFRV